MDDAEFDKALIAAAFALASERGWHRLNAAEAATRAGVSLARARERFPGRAAILLRFGRLADQAALAEPPREGTVRDRLFYLLMQRIDTLQTHREGVLALLRALRREPETALLLACATRRSMRWMLQAAGVATHGLRGELRVKGLLGVWMWAIRAWQSDDTADMSHTMAAMDSALGRVERLAGWLGGATPPTPSPPGDEIPPAEPPSPESPPPPAPAEPPEEPRTPPPMPPTMPPPPESPA
ncbi:MAG TPA: TetR family transcriptional regulator [Acetobacteraceae bacterium]